MKLLIYSAQNQGIGKNLANRVHHEFPQILIDEVNSIKRLSDKLCRPLHGITVIIVNICDQKEIIILQNLKPLLENIRLILVLPSRAKNMMKLGLELYPSFTCYSDSDFNDIKLVLEKLQRI